MRIFLIAPHRKASPQYKEAIADVVSFVEKQQGHAVYWPARDTDQNDRTGLRICQDNRTAMEKADMVVFAWDGKSQECLFDLGMAFAMGKPIRALAGYVPRMTRGKSFQNMVYDWEENGP